MHRRAYGVQSGQYLSDGKRRLGNTADTYWTRCALDAHNQRRGTNTQIDYVSVTTLIKGETRVETRSDSGAVSGHRHHLPRKWGRQNVGQKSPPALPRWRGRDLAATTEYRQSIANRWWQHSQVNATCEPAETETLAAALRVPHSTATTRAKLAVRQATEEVDATKEYWTHD